MQSHTDFMTDALAQHINKVMCKDICHHSLSHRCWHSSLEILLESHMLRKIMVMHSKAFVMLLNWHTQQVRQPTEWVDSTALHLGYKQYTATDRKVPGRMGLDRSCNGTFEAHGRV